MQQIFLLNRLKELIVAEKALLITELLFVYTNTLYASICAWKCGSMPPKYDSSSSMCEHLSNLVTIQIARGDLMYVFFNNLRYDVLHL